MRAAPLKILALVHQYPPGHNAGAELMLHVMLRELAAAGHQCTVAHHRTPKPITELDGVAIRTAPAHDDNLIRAVRAADVLITHLDVTRRAVRIARAAKRPIVHLLHNDRQLEHHSVHPDDADLVVANSEWIAQRYAGWEDRLAIVRPPVFVDDYKVEPVGDNVTLININSAKGSGILIDLAKTERRRSFLGIRGAYGVQAQMPRGVRNLTFAGHTADILGVYAKTRVLLMPSSYESWGRCAIEAACSGIPTIAAPTPGLRESLGAAGLFAQRTRLGEWRGHLGDLDDDGYYRDCSERARARATELDALAHADITRFERHLQALTGAYPGSTDEEPHMILRSPGSGRRCAVCGASRCACGPTSDTPGQPVFRAAVGRGLPLKVYRTERGDFRFNLPSAQRRGLEPDGPAINPTITRNLERAGWDLRRHVSAYAAATDDARLAYLTLIAQTRSTALYRIEDEALAILTDEPATPTPPVPEPHELEESFPADGRAGEVLAWASNDATRLRFAIDHETDHKNRVTLIRALTEALKKAEE